MLLLIIPFLVLLIDQLVKSYACQNLSYGQCIPIIGNFLYLTNLKNSGGLFGFLPPWPLFFLVIHIVAVFLIGGYYWWARPQEWVSRLALGFEMGGALGNMIDRLLWGGKVLDVLAYRHIFAFNLADLAIIFGISLHILVLLALFGVRVEFIERSVEKKDQALLKETGRRLEVRNRVIQEVKFAKWT